LLDESNAHATDGSRTERGVFIYQNANCDVYTEDMGAAIRGSGGLLNHLDPSNPPAPAEGYTLVAEMHTHPFDTTYYDSSLHTEVSGLAPPSQADLDHTPTGVVGIVVSANHGTYYFNGQGN